MGSVKPTTRLVWSFGVALATGLGLLSSLLSAKATKAAAGFLDEGDPSGVLALRGCSGDGALTCWIFLKKALCNRSLRPLLGVLAVKAFLGDRPRSEPKKASDWVGIDQ